LEQAFDLMAPLYDSWFETPLGQTVDELEKDLLYCLARPKVGKRALDVGTGTGHFAFDLAARGLEVVGIDISQPMLAVARAKSSAARLILADAANLPLPGDSFDLTLAVTTLEFVARPDDALAEMWRVTRPGGRVVIGVLNALSPWAWVRWLEARRGTPFSHAHFYRPAEFVKALRRFGKVQWSSSVFIGPNGWGLGRAWDLERFGRRYLKPFGVLVGGVIKMG